MRFVLPLPPSTNNLFVTLGNKRVKSSRYSAWLKEAGQMVVAQRVGQFTPDAPYSVEVWCYFSDNRKRDADNYHKAVQDLLSSTLHFPDELVIDASQHKRKAVSRDREECVVYLRHSAGRAEIPSDSRVSKGQEEGSGVKV